jgi:hypothetical protein
MEEEAGINSYAKKRVNHSSEYRRNVIKKATIHGEEHVNYIGKTVPREVSGEDCKCCRGCFSIIAKDNRSLSLTYILNMESKNDQDLFLQGLIIASDVQRHRPRNEKGCRNDKSFCYFILVGDK